MKITKSEENFFHIFVHFELNDKNNSINRLRKNEWTIVLVIATGWFKWQMTPSVETILDTFHSKMVDF